MSLNVRGVYAIASNISVYVYVNIKKKFLIIELIHFNPTMLAFFQGLWSNIIILSEEF